MSDTMILGVLAIFGLIVFSQMENSARSAQTIGNSQALAFQSGQSSQGLMGLLSGVGL